MIQAIKAIIGYAIIVCGLSGICGSVLAAIVLPQFDNKATLGLIIGCFVPFFLFYVLNDLDGDRVFPGLFEDLKKSLKK